MRSSTNALVDSFQVPIKFRLHIYQQSIDDLITVFNEANNAVSSNIHDIVNYEEDKKDDT